MNLIIIYKYSINIISFIFNKFIIYNLVFSKLFLIFIIINKLRLKINNP